VTDTPQSILSHLEELRWRLVKIGIAVLVGAVVAFIFADPLRGILEEPFFAAAPDNTFQALKPGEEWGVLMRISLTPRERKWAIPVVAALTLLFAGGVLFGYFVLPRGLSFLLGIFPDVQNDLLIGDYYSFVLRFLLAFGLAFLYPVFLFAAAAAGLISSRQMASGRRWAVLLVVVGAALITPTGDILNLMILAVPLYLMYEITYWLVRLILKK
jgi:sec-independent protein translocase protein TatC